MRLLVVEDQGLITELIADRLGREPDIDVVGSTSSMRRALELAAELSPDVVTTSYRLDDGDGIQLAKAMPSVSAASRVVMVTALKPGDLLRAALGVGCAGIVSKFASVENLLLAVRAASHGEVLIGQPVLSRLIENRRLRAAGSEGTDLTPREFEVLNLFSEGLTDRAIAERLGLADKTVRNHVQVVLSKLGARSKLDALAIAIKRGLILIQ
jgi:two-component system, NarL family, nitrate/nitrite response regulator NarL